MSGAAWSLALAVFHLALALLVVARGRRDPLAVSFSVLSTILAIYKTLEYVSDLRPSVLFDRLEVAAASLSTIPALYFFASFAGLRSRLRFPLLLAAFYFGGLALAMVLAPAPVGVREDPLARWSIPFVVGMAVSFLPALGLLVWRWLRTTGEEHFQGQLVLGGLLLGAGGGATDLLAAADRKSTRLNSSHYS